MKYSFSSLLLACLLISSSFNTQAADNFYEQALQSYQQQEYDASYIYLKNALQANPKNLPAKLLKGQLLTRNGYYEEAIKEFRQAIEYKIDINLVLLPLGNVLTFNSQYQDVIDLGKGFKLTDESTFEWKMLAASAYSNLGEPELARAEYNAAIKLYPNNTRAINSLAFLDLSDNKLDNAEKQASKSLKIAPGDHRTWHLKGKIAEATGDIQQAIEFYRTALKIESDDPVAKRSLAYALISTDQLAEAKAVADSIIQQTPDDPFAMLLSSWILSKNEQGDLANNILDSLSSKLTLVTDATFEQQDALLFVKGMTEYVQGNFEQARSTLAKYVNKNRQDLNATAMLAEIYISMGQNDAAMHILERVEDKLIDKLPLALKLADLYLKNGKDFKADYWLSKLREFYPDDIKVILMSSKALIARGKMDQAIKLIEDSSNKNSQNSSLLLARGFLYIQNGQFEQALKASEMLIKADDRNVDYWNLNAAALLRLDRDEEAQQAIDNVLAISPNHFAGRFNQAMILKNAGQFSQARTLLNRLVEEQPSHHASQFQLALVESVDNNLQPAISRLERLTIIESRNIKAQLLLLNLYLKNQQTDVALRLVNKLVKEFPLEPEFSIKRAEILIANRDVDDAKLQLTKLYNLWLDNPQKLFRLSSMQQSVEDFEGANNTLLKALSYLPKHLLLNLEYARLNLQLNETQVAQDVANDMEKQYGKNPNISLLKGDIALAKENYLKAHEYYVNAISMQNDYQLPLIRLYELARRGVQEQEFSDLVKRLLEEQPENNWRRKLLADHLMNQNKWLEAKAHYLQLIEQDKINKDYSILNNLANIYMQDDLPTALAYAKRALESANTVPAVLDTHGWILVKLGRFEDGLVSLRQAHAISSNDLSIQYHIAFTLQKLGRTAEAKAELEKTLASKDEFSERTEAEKLLSSI
ncbi:XrtA/PEP-CTERM system TPR-repeat protein PrsT [Paraglaciecola sp.]|uniref:XrtA/PEP-CTERM system TPR-repeat protein PrsT n=1 Tax=Paraglaciecola sp. TaxID=1920173 RepID=UPI0030F43051